MATAAAAKTAADEAAQRAREWRADLNRLKHDRPPRGVPLKRWLAFLEDLARFYEAGWAQRAAALGWDPYQLFGCDRAAPLARLDHMGLVWHLDQAEIVELAADRATFETITGARQVCHAHQELDPDEVCLPWELPDMTSELLPGLNLA